MKQWGKRNNVLVIYNLISSITSAKLIADNLLCPLTGREKLKRCWRRWCASFVPVSTVTLRKDTVDVGMKWQDELPQWMEQQLFCSLYNVNSSFVTIVQWALFYQTSTLYSYISLLLVITLDTLLRINKGRCPKIFGTIKRCSEKTTGPFQKAAVTVFQSVCDILFAESTWGGISWCWHYC